MKLDKYQVIIVLLSLAIITALIYFIYAVYNGKLGRVAVSVDTVYAKSRVSINDQDRGETPVYTQDLYAGDIKVAINGDNGANYSTIVKPSSNTLALVKRDLGVSEAFSSGQNIWFEKSSPANESFINITSPSVEEVAVSIDGNDIGKTPVKISTKSLLNQSETGKYKLSLKKDGYEEQEVQVVAKNGYTVNIRVDMFLNPLPNNITLLDGFTDGTSFINFSNVSNVSFEDKKSWSKAVNYWLKTRGAANFGNTKIEKFNFFLSDDGKVYNDEGNDIQAEELKGGNNIYVAYLGTKNATNLSESALQALSKSLGKEVANSSSSNGTTAGQKMVKVKNTPVGFLRVRSDASTASSELAKLDVGKEVPFVEEKSGWVKVEYETGKQGWVSSVYVEKLGDDAIKKESAKTTPTSSASPSTSKSPNTSASPSPKPTATPKPSTSP